ncbi:hypothetical protein Syun_031186 [Stephania yunnanensis]|uniref:NAC domain-containing protein n=1 Tax=Stephania yunnanensis TaxID=152371 RepID=A0AAP0DYF9_9MAGN
MMKREIDAEAELNLPPGFRFHPTDEELVVHYLCRKISYQTLPVPIIAEIDLYKYNPWQLPDKALFGRKEWYFFTPRDRKYPNGSRPNRAAGSGYWKATGADKPIKPQGSAIHLGIKKALVFYSGKAPKGVKTDWIMHEYRLAESKQTTKKMGSLRLDDWVLCRLYNKKNNWHTIQNQTQTSSVEETIDSFEAVEGVDSLNTPESDVENDQFMEFNGLNNNNTQMSNQGQAFMGGVQSRNNIQIGEHVKVEDNDWFVDLKLDDLHNSGGVFGGDPPLQDLGYQDYNFSSLCSPHLKSSNSTYYQQPFWST